jgi:hypothetical protein
MLLLPLLLLLFRRKTNKQNTPPTPPTPPRVCVYYYKEKSLSRFFWGLCVQRCSFFVCVCFVLVGEKAKKERDRPTDDDDVFF